jgi:hypothetical protein
MTTNKLPSKRLVRLAKEASAAARAHAKAERDFLAVFKAEYGHDQLSDELVDIVSYGGGGITSAWIAVNSDPDTNL